MLILIGYYVVVVGKEVTIEVLGWDKDLAGDMFMCLGSDYVHPDYQGDLRGRGLHFVATREANNSVVSSIPVIGCDQFENGQCKIGRRLCPVKGAVDMDAYEKRQKELQGLIRITK